MPQRSLATFTQTVPFAADYRGLLDAPRPDFTASVLVIDGNPLFRQAIKGTLEAVGYQVVTSTSVEEGIRLAQARRPDAIVVDLVLAAPDPASWLQRLGGHGAAGRVPCIVTGASGDPDDEIAALDAGADDFLSKTKGLRLLRHRLKAHLRRKAAADDQRQALIAQHRVDIERLEARSARDLEALRQGLLAAADCQLRAVAPVQETARLLTGVSGELRTSLNDIIGFSQLLGRELFGPLTDRQRDYVSQIQDAGRQLLHLVHELLDVARLDADQLGLERTPTAVGRLLDAVAGVVRPLAQAQGIDVSLAVAPDLPDALVDRTRLRQVLYNLMTCALRSTAGGGVLRVEARSAQDGLLLVVRGEPHRVSRLPVDPQAGATALAVAMARRLVALHEGHLETHPGPELAFTMTLPLQ